MAVLGTATAIIDLDISGLMSKAGQAEGALNRLGSTSGKGLDSFTSKIGNVSTELTMVGKGAVAFGAVIGTAFTFGVKSAVSFEKQMSAVQSVSGATGGDIDKLRQEALRLGKDTSFSASESAQAMEIMIKAGASLPDVLNGATEQILNLANATGVEVPLAAETASAAVNVFGSDYETVANVIAQSANASALDVNDWALAIKSVGPVAKASGMTVQDLGASMVILGDAGIKGEVGATALRNILLSLGDSTDDGSVALADYGIATRDASGNMRSLNDITADLVPVWNDLNAEQKQNLATQIAGKDGYAAFTTIMDAQTKSVANNSTAFADAKKRMDGTGTAAEQAAIRMDNLAGAWEQFKGSLETIAITIGSTLLPALKAIVDAGTGLLNFILTIPAPITTAIAAIAGIVSVIALLGGAFLLILPKIAEFNQALTAIRAAGLFAGFGAAIPIILGVAAAIGALYLAYRTNFLGIGDGIDAVIGKIRGFAESAKGAFDSLMAGIGNFIDNFRSAWDALAPAKDAAAGVSSAFDAVGSSLGKVSAPMAAMSNAIKGFFAPAKQLAAPLTAIGAAASAISGPFLTMSKTMTDVSGAVGRLVGVTDPLVRGMLSVAGVTDSVTSKFDGVGRSAQQVVAPITSLQRVILALAAAFRGISGDDTPAFFVAIADVLDGLSKSVGILEKDITALMNALGLFGDGLGSLLSGDWSKAVDEFSKAWGDTGKALRKLGTDLKKFGGDGVRVLRNVAAAGFTELGKAAHTAFTNIGNSFLDIGRLFPALRAPLTALGTGFKQFGDAAYNALTGVADALRGDIPTAMQRFGLAFDQGKQAVTQFVTGLSGIAVAAGNMAITIGGWIVSSAVDLGSTIADWVQNTALPNIGSAAATVWGVLVSIGSWAQGVIADIAPKVAEWAATALDGAAGAAATAWGVLVDIGSWAKGIISDIWPYITMWTSSLISGVSSAAGTLWGVIVNIGSWAQGIISDIWPYITQWTSSLISGVSNAAGTLWGVIVNIGSWAKGIVSDIAPFITQWATAAATGITTAAVTIWGVLVNIGSWALGTIPALWSFIKLQIASLWAAISGTEMPLSEPVKLSVGSFEATIDSGKIWDAIGTALDNASFVSDETLMSGHNWGEKIGKKIIDAIIGSMGSGGGTGSGSGGKNNDLMDLAHSIADGLVDGLVSRIKERAGDLKDALTGAFKSAFDGIDPSQMIPKELMLFLKDPVGYAKGEVVGSKNAKTGAGGAYPGGQLHPIDAPGTGGGKTGNVFINQLPKVGAGPGQGGTKQAQETIVALKALEKEYETAATAATTFASATGVALTGLATGFIATGSLISTAITGWATAMTTFTTNVATMGSTAGASLTALATGFIMTGTLISAGITTWSSSLTTFVTAVATMASTAGASLTALATGFIATGTLISSAITSWGTGLAGFATAVSTMGSTAGASLTGLATGFIATATLITTALTTIKAALTDIPPSTKITISQTGGEAVAATAAIANAAISAVPTAWSTTFSESGGGPLAATAAIANAAISAIPRSWSTAFSSSGADAVIGAANSIASAINSIPSSKTVTVSIATSGSVPALAKGGVVPRNTTVARLAERGPELFRNPSGTWGIARTDSLYPMTPGARVFTAAQTKRMLRTWNGPAYANGGRVATPTRASMTSGGNTYNSGAPVTVHAQIHTQGRMDDGEKRQFVQEIATSFRDGINLVHMGKGGS